MKKVNQSVIKYSKQLKNSKTVKIEFKTVSISPDLSVCQRKKSNNLNDELNHLPFEVNYYYGIRNNKITKLKKEIDQFPIGNKN